MMRPIRCSLVAIAACGALWSLPSVAADDLEPAVNTSAPEQARAASSTATQAQGQTQAPTPDRLAVPSRAISASPAATAPATGAAPASAAAPASGRSAPPRAATTAAGGSARDRVELENTQITGNRELPKVMYVVPWKKPDLGDFGGRPAKSLLDELLEPVDRDVFKRQNRYFEALQPDAGQKPARDEK
jgi:hypothetical protein